MLDFDNFFRLAIVAFHMLALGVELQMCAAGIAFELVCHEIGLSGLLIKFAHILL